MRHYELVTILSPMLNQDDASATWDEIKSFITNREGEITAEQTWGTRRLAYPIRKGNYNFLEGSYYLSSFAVDNPFNRELENYLRLHDNVLRALVVRCDGPLADKPAPGPLTAPSRYIPPGRGRRNDGGGPIPEAPAGATERGSGPPAGAVPAAPPSEASPATPSAPADAPVTEATPEAPPAAQAAYPRPLPQNPWPLRLLPPRSQRRSPRPTLRLRPLNRQQRPNPTPANPRPKVQRNPGMNKIIIIGNLGRDPEMRYSPSGNPMTSFSIASNRRYTTAAGEQREETEWFNCTAFGRLADVCNQYLTRGQQVYVEGRLRSRQYDRRDGTPGFSLDVNVTEMQMLGRRGDQPDDAGGYGGGYGEQRGGYAASQDAGYGEPRGGGYGSYGAGDPADSADVDDLPF